MRFQPRATKGIRAEFPISGGLASFPVSVVALIPGCAMDRVYVVYLFVGLYL